MLLPVPDVDSLLPTWIDDDHQRPHIRRVQVHRETFAIDRFEHHIFDTQTENVDQERTWRETMGARRGARTSVPRPISNTHSVRKQC
jgi:hypothetical protein